MNTVGFEGFELLFSSARERFFFVTGVGEPTHTFFTQQVESTHLMVLTGDGEDDTLITQEGFTEWAKKAGSLWVTAHASPVMERWSQTHGIPLISPTHELQMKLENKIFFEIFAEEHHLPTPSGRILTTQQEAVDWDQFPSVLQIPRSHGGQGTFYVENRTDWEQRIQDMAMEFPLLVRRYVDGMSLGVTLLITENEMIFSALREQMIFIKEAQLNKYVGIEWIPSDRIGENGLKKIEEVLTRLGRALQSMSYRGPASIDFMWDGTDMLLIECNPRAALSSIQLSHQPSLFHGLNYCEEVLAIFDKGSLSCDLPRIPRSAFCGATLDMDYFGAKQVGRRVKTSLPIGVYTLDGTLKKRGGNELDFPGKNEIFIACPLPSGSVVSEKSDMGLALTNHPITENKAMFDALTTLLVTLAE